MGLGIINFSNVNTCERILKQKDLDNSKNIKTS